MTCQLGNKGRLEHDTSPGIPPFASHSGRGWNIPRILFELFLIRFDEQFPIY
jgi:hypothetical protein